MKPNSEQKDKTLLNRIEGLWKILHRDQPAVVDELQALLRVIEGRRLDASRPMADIERKPSIAVMTLMHELQRPMTRQQIFDELESRGVEMSSLQRGYVNDAILRLLKSGDLVDKGGERKDKVVALPNTRK